MLVGALATEVIVAVSILVVGGESPARRIAVSGALVVAAVLALAGRRRLGPALLRRPRLLLAVASGYAVLTAWDDQAGSTPFGSTGFPILCVAAVVGGTPRLVVEAAAILGGGRILGWVVVGGSSGAEAIVGDVLLYLGAAAVLVVTVGAFGASLSNVPGDLASMREAGDPRLGAGPGPPPALPRADAAGLIGRLTPAERRVVDGLAEGLLPKQVALKAGVSLATVRVQIRAAKRKTGARTLKDLAGLLAAAGRSEGDGHG